MQGSSHDSSSFFVADSATRLASSSPSPLLANAQRVGVRNLPGTDPLPMAAEQSRLGSFGFQLICPVDLTRPLLTVQTALLQNAEQPIHYGKGETLFGFVSKQARMQLRKRVPALRL